MVYSDKLSAYYLELAQSSSSETRFSGEDVRFSGEYEALENELSKAHSIHGHSQPDWQKIVEKSDALLRHESKDLRVAVWLTWALYQRESFPGLLAGLGLLRYLCEHHWAVVYPRKPRTRCAAFTWLVPRIEQVFTQSLSLKDQRPLFECMLEHLSRLDQLWSELLGDEAPLLLPIRRQLADRLQQVAESNPRPGGGSGVITQIKQVTTQLLSPEHVVDNEKDAHKLLRVLQDNARPLCAWWLRQNATDLRALRLSRTLTWLAIGTLPECDHEYVTPLRGPAPDKLKRYQERFQQGCHADLLPELEASLTLAPFWFDGLRMVWECLQGLQAHLAMIEMEVCFALLLQRLPGLAQLRFHDGTPFAESLASVVYRILRDQARNLEPYRFSQHLDPQGRVFAGIDQPIPGFYTQRYVRYFAGQGTRLVNTLVQENWVLGEGTDLSPMDLRRLMVELEQRYFSEYAEAWSEALGQVRLQDTDTARQGAEQLANLTSAQSPLLQLLQQVREHTRFPSAADRLDELAAGKPGPVMPLGQVTQVALGSTLAAISNESSDTARRALQRRFESLHQLLDEQHNPGIELTQALQALNQLHLQLATLSREGQPEQAAFDMVRQRMQGQQDALSDLRNVAMRLPLPLASWIDGLADSHWRRVLDDAYRHVNQRYQSEVYGFYTKAIKQRYPFDAHASSDVALDDFHEFFRPHGVMMRFFDGYLRPFVSGDAGRYRLRSLDGRSLPMSRALLDQWGKAQVIRRGFFADDRGPPHVRFTLAPYSLDSAVSRAIFRFGGQQMEYRHGPIVPMAFQWPTETEDGRSSLVLERGVERPLGIEKNTGLWSLFRLFDLMQSEPLSGRDVRVLKADLGGLHANYLLTSQSTSSPFDLAAWRTFRIPEQL